MEIIARTRSMSGVKTVSVTRCDISNNRCTGNRSTCSNGFKSQTVTYSSSGASLKTGLVIIKT